MVHKLKANVCMYVSGYIHDYPFSCLQFIRLPGKVKFAISKEPLLPAKTERCGHMITDCVWPEVCQLILTLLHKKFPNRLISRFDYINWPLNSNSLTPLGLHCAALLFKFISKYGLSLSKMMRMIYVHT